MHLLIENDTLLQKLVNKQFEMIGSSVTIQELEAMGGVEVKKGNRTVIEDYRKHYFFESEEQYNTWLKWVAEEIMRYYDIQVERTLQDELNYVDLRYGLYYKDKGGN